MSSGPEPIHVDYSPKLGDYLKATMVEAATSPANAALAGAFFSMGIFLILNDDPLGWTSMALGLLSITSLYSAPYICWNARRRADLMLSHRRLTADGSGIRIETGTSNVELTWSTFRKVRQQRDSFVLDYGTGVALMIPTRSFTPEDIAAFRALADGAGRLDTSPRWPRTIIGIALGICIVVIGLLVVASMA